jgi:hypothetical protein
MTVRLDSGLNSRFVHGINKPQSQISMQNLKNTPGDSLTKFLRNLTSDLKCGITSPSCKWHIKIKLSRLRTFSLSCIIFVYFTYKSQKHLLSKRVLCACVFVCIYVFMYVCMYVCIVCVCACVRVYARAPERHYTCSNRPFYEPRQWMRDIAIYQIKYTESFPNNIHVLTPTDTHTHLCWNIPSLLFFLIRHRIVSFFKTGSLQWRKMWNICLQQGQPQPECVMAYSGKTEVSYALSASTNTKRMITQTSEWAHSEVQST